MRVIDEPRREETEVMSTNYTKTQILHGRGRRKTPQIGIKQHRFPGRTKDLTGGDELAGVTAMIGATMEGRRADNHSLLSTRDIVAKKAKLWQYGTWRIKGGVMRLSG